MGDAEKPPALYTIGDFVEYRSNTTGKRHLLHWSQIAEVTEGNECCLIRMSGATTDFLANVDYLKLKAWLWEKTEREKDKRAEWP